MEYFERKVESLNELEKVQETVERTLRDLKDGFDRTINEMLIQAKGFSDKGLDDLSSQMKDSAEALKSIKKTESGNLLTERRRDREEIDDILDKLGRLKDGVKDLYRDSESVIKDPSIDWQKNGRLDAEFEKNFEQLKMAKDAAEAGEKDANLLRNEFESVKQNWHQEVEQKYDELTDLRDDLKNPNEKRQLIKNTIDHLKSRFEKIKHELYERTASHFGKLNDLENRWRDLNEREQNALTNTKDTRISIQEVLEEKSEFLKEVHAKLIGSYQQHAEQIGKDQAKIGIAESEILTRKKFPKEIREIATDQAGKIIGEISTKLFEHINEASTRFQEMKLNFQKYEADRISSEAEAKSRENILAAERALNEIHTEQKQLNEFRDYLVTHKHELENATQNSESVGKNKFNKAEFLLNQIDEFSKRLERMQKKA
jgi:hypothetical protein